MSKIEGGCLCGKVRYQASGEASMVVVCHCTHCRRQSGSAFSMNIGVPTAALQVDGEALRRYQDTGDSGLPVYRHFCGECGSPIYSLIEVMPDMAFVKAGTLDDPSWVEPGVQVYCDSRLTWSRLPDGLASFPKAPG